MHTFRLDHQLSKFTEVFDVKDSEPPILSPEIRQSVRQWLVEINASEELVRYGLKPRRTAMLYGPPGCGKTTLAHHFAARLGLALVVVNMASVVSSFVGATGNNINCIFDSIERQADACVLFLDEFDSLGLTRSNDGQSASKERNGVVISLLQKIDSFSGILIAATNMGTEIDPALWRRFGMHLDIIEPDEESRFAILTRYLSPFSIPDAGMDILVELTKGATPAILRQLMEGIKREMILGERHQLPMDIRSVFIRLISAVRPHAKTNWPDLWKQPNEALDRIESIQWPPSDQSKKDEAA